MLATAIGSTITVSYTGAVINSVAGTDCLGLDLTAGTLSGFLILDPDQSPAVELTCGENGLSALLNIDGSSTAPISITDDGLKVDCCADPSPQNVFIQADDPGPLDYPYLWVVTGPGPGDFTINVREP